MVSLLAGCAANTEEIIAQSVKELQAQADTESTDEMQVSYSQRGTVIVCTCTLLQEDLDIEATKANIAAQEASWDAQFQPRIDVVKVLAPGASLIVEIVTKDGVMLFTKEYK